MELCASGGNKPSTMINHFLISQSHINQPFVIPNMELSPSPSLGHFISLLICKYIRSANVYELGLLHPLV